MNKKRVWNYNKQRRQAGNAVVALLVVILIMAAVIAVMTVSCMRRNNAQGIATDEAEKNKDRGLYFTVINNTENIINKVQVSVGDGTIISSDDAQKENPDNKNVNLLIPEEYRGYGEFTIILTDRYDAEYRKTITDTPEKGRVEVIMTKEDRVKESESLQGLIDRIFNGDK